MKRIVLVVLAAFALLVPTVTAAQVKTIYVPGAHPHVVVVPPDKAPPAEPKVNQAPPTPEQIIARHEPMARSQRTANRVNYSAVAHCERLVAEAKAALHKNF